MATALRPLSTGELLDRVFSLYRSHFGLFIGIFALPHLAVLAFKCLGLAFQPSGPPMAHLFARLPWIYGALFLSLIFGAVSQAATVLAVSQVHLDRPASVVSSFSRIKGHILGVIGISLIVSVAGGMALLALIVPGVFLFMIWSLSIPAKVLEDKGVFDAMSRSIDLTQGSRWRIFVIGVLFFVLALAVNWLLQWPLKLATGLSGEVTLQPVAIGWQVSSMVATFVSECLVGPLGTIAFALVYYDQRVRKEAFDLQLMMTTMDASALPGVPAQAGA
jgi:hypothetical protein